MLLGHGRPARHNAGVADPTWDALLLSTAAVAAAGMAAWTANRRIDKQLDAESQRLDKQLAHDR